MPDWFSNIVQSKEPGPQELMGFIRGVNDFLAFVLEQKEFDFLWEFDPELQKLATDSFIGDVRPAIMTLFEKIRNIPKAKVKDHGLEGSPLRFKLRVIDAIARQYEQVRGRGILSIRAWLKKLIDAVDALLDSIVDAAGVGGIITEFKDALGALADPL